jgi:hypothetical protein
LLQKYVSSLGNRPRCGVDFNNVISLLQRGQSGTGGGLSLSMTGNTGLGGVPAE